MLTPEEIEGREFLVSLRGFDRAEVRAFLSEVADHVRDLEDLAQQADAARDAQTADASDASAGTAGPAADAREAAEAADARQAAEAADAREAAEAADARSAASAMFADIGQETARILDAAQEAAQGLLRQARVDADRQKQQARQQAARIIAEGEQRRDEIEEVVAGLEAARESLSNSLHDVALTIDRVLDELGTPPQLASTVREALTAEAASAATGEAARAAEEKAPAATGEAARAAEEKAPAAEDDAPAAEEEAPAADGKAPTAVATSAMEEAPAAEPTTAMEEAPAAEPTTAAQDDTRPQDAEPTVDAPGAREPEEGRDGAGRAEGAREGRDPAEEMRDDREPGEGAREVAEPGGDRRASDGGPELPAQHAQPEDESGGEPQPVDRGPAARDDGDDAGEPADQRDGEGLADVIIMQDDDGGSDPQGLRGQALTALHQPLVRTIKRELQEAHNVVLDGLRRTDGQGELESLLPDDEGDRFGIAAAEYLDAAYQAGVHAAGILTGRDLPAPTTQRDLLAEFAADATARVNSPLAATLRMGRSASEPPPALYERVGAVFAELRSSVAEELAGGHVIRAYELGMLDAWTAGGITHRRWVLGREPRCPEARCRHNDRAVVAMGETYPSGDDVPPIHVGCTCTTVPVSEPRS